MVDEETMQKIIAIGLLLLMVGVWLTFNSVRKLDGGEVSCDPLIDTIYQQCSEEGHINLTTIKGRTKTLEYTNGVCIIK